MERNRLAPIGRTMMVLAAEHGMETRTALLKRLASHGHHLAPESVRDVVYGRAPMYRAFARALRESLPLTPDQHQRLASDYMTS